MGIMPGERPRAGGLFEKGNEVQMNTCQKGDLCELCVLSKLVEKGLHIAIPYGNQLNWDLLVEIDGEWKKIQVKSAHKRLSGRLEVDCIKSGPSHTDRSTGRKYENGAFDILMAVDIPTRTIWSIPFDVVYGRRSLSLEDKYLFS